MHHFTPLPWYIVLRHANAGHKNPSSTGPNRVCLKQSLMQHAPSAYWTSFSRRPKRCSHFARHVRVSQSSCDLYPGSIDIIRTVSNTCPIMHWARSRSSFKDSRDFQRVRENPGTACISHYLTFPIILQGLVAQLIYYLRRKSFKSQGRH
jgi:hypothetical protein